LEFATFLVWRLRIGGYGLALVVFGAYDSYPTEASYRYRDSRELWRSDAQETQREFTLVLNVKTSTQSQITGLKEKSNNLLILVISLDYRN